MQKPRIKILLILLFGILLLNAGSQAQQKKNISKEEDVSNKSENKSEPALSDEYFISKAYERLNRRHLSIDNPDTDLEFIEIRRSPAFPLISIRFRQMIDGIPVESAILKMRFRLNGKYISTSGNYFPEAKKVNTTASISEERAIALALDDERSNGASERDSRAELVIAKHKDKFRLIWKVQCGHPSRMIPVDYKIDAQTGELLEYTRPIGVIK